MNKRFYTLMAGIMLAGSAFSTASAKDVKGDDFLKAINQTTGVLDVSEKGLGLTKDDMVINLTESVELTSLTGNTDEMPKKYVIINTKGVKLTTDKTGVSLKGRLVIAAEEVEVSNLKLINELPKGGKGANGQFGVIGGFWNNTAVTVFADKATIKNNTITGSVDKENATNCINGVIVYPQGKEVAYTIEKNTLKGFNKLVIDTDNAPGDAWYSSAIQIYQNAKRTESQGTTGENIPSALKGLKGIASASATIEKGLNVSDINSKNTFEGNNADVFVRTNLETESLNYKVNAAYVGKDGDGSALVDAIESISSEGTIEFGGTVAEYNKKLEGKTVTKNSAVKTKEGVVVSGAKTLDAKLDDFELVTNISDKDSYETSDYYLLVMKNDADKSYLVTADANGKPTLKEWSTKADGDTEDDKNLWKMEQALDLDNDYTFVFTNKAGKKLTIERSAEKINTFHSVGNAPYGYGVVFNMNGTNLHQTTKKLYFGLYKSAAHKLTAAELNWYENGGFSMSFDLEEDEVLKGTDAFAGRLTATPATGVVAKDAYGFSLVNEDGKYIVAKKTNAAGTLVNQYIYAFELVSKKVMDEELKKADKDRTLFNEFSFYYTPKSADDDLQAIEKIDEIKIKVINKDGALEEALVGSYLLTTDKTNTLGASIEYGLTPVVINMGDNVVVPEEFLKNQKGFVTIKQLNEESDDLYFAATECNGYGLKKAYGNPLEIQWAVQYDKEKKEYTLVNRENNNIKVTGIDYKWLRENDNKEDNIYVCGSKKYEITFVEAGESKDFYMYLGDVKNKKFKMAHWSGVYNNRAWFTVDEDANALINIDEDKALEFTAHNGKVAADTMKVATYVNYYDADKKEWKKQDHELQVPVYIFSTEEGLFGYDGGISNFDYDNTATRLVIRNNGEHYNLRPLTTVENKEVMACQKVYVGTSNEEAGFLYMANGLYVTDKNDLFDVVDNDRPEYRRLGTTLATDGFTSKVDTAKFFRTNGVKNLYLYENTMNRNTDKERSLNFLGEVQSDYLPEKVQLPFVVDTAFVRDNTPKPLYLLAVRTNEVKAEADKPCDVPGHGMNCEHAVKGHEGYRTGDYLVALDDSLNIKDLDVKFNGYTRLAFVPAKHIGDTLQIMSSKWTSSKDEDEVAKDSIFFSDTDKNGVVSQLGENAAAFAFKLVDPKKAVEEGMVDFYIENIRKMENGPDQVRYVQVLNSVPVLVNELHEASTFNVEAAAEGETPTANEGIATEGVSVVATNGAVIVKGAEGKNVVITNVLGQQVANTVVSSSEATIAAPAGIVVVAVEGEAAVKAIVK